MLIPAYIIGDVIAKYGISLIYDPFDTSAPDRAWEACIDFVDDVDGGHSASARAYGPTPADALERLLVQFGETEPRRIRRESP